MANDLKKVGLVFKADGSVNFTKTLKQVNTQLKLNYQELKLTQSQYDKNTSSAERLADEQKYLTEAIGLQKEKIRQCKEALEQLNTAEVKNENAIAQAKIQVASAETSLARYEKQLNKVNLKLESGSTKFEEYSNKAKTASDKLNNVGKKMSKVSAGIVGIGTAALVSGANFEESMSKVKATSGATKEEFEKLKKKAEEMGAKTKFSASESANAMYYMALAGWKTDDMLQGLDGIMNLAAASGEDLATVSDIVTDGLTSMGYSANESAKFSDIFAKTVTNSNTDVAGLGEAMKYTGSIAGALNLDIEDVSLALGLMANSGVKASQAGTSLRAILQRISTNTDGARNVIEELGVEVFDSEGKMRDFGDVISDLRIKFANLTDEQKTEIAKTVAGTTAMSGFLAIVNSGEDDFNMLTNAVNNAEGAAEKMSKEMIDNAKGDFTLIKSQLESLAIQISKILLPIIRQILEKVSGFLTWLSNLDSKTQKVILTILAVIAAIGPMLIIFGKVATGISSILKLVSIVKELKTVTTGLSLVLKLLSGIGIVGLIVGIITIIVLLVKHIKKLWDTNDEFRNSVLNAWNNIVDKFNAINDFFKNIFSTDFTKTFGILGEPINAFLLSISQLYDSFKQILSGITDFIKGVFTGDWELAWTGIKKIFLGVFDGLLAIAKRPLNGIIGFLNMLIAGINVLIRGINKIKIKTPDWIPGIGGKELGFNIGQLGKIPYLAKGGTLLNGAAIVAESGPEMLLQEGNKTRVIPLNSKSKNTNVKPNQENNFNVTINSNSKYLNEAEAARQARKELQALALRLRRG